MVVKIGPDATVHPSAKLDGNIRVYGNAVIGPGTVLGGWILVTGNANISNVTIEHYEKPGIVFAGDCFIDSDDDWFVDDDPKAPWPWAVYRTARSEQNKPVWQASAGCVMGVDLDSDGLDWSDEQTFRDEANLYVSERNSQLNRVSKEIARRGGFKRPGKG